MILDGHRCAVMRQPPACEGSPYVHRRCTLDARRLRCPESPTGAREIPALTAHKRYAERPRTSEVLMRHGPMRKLLALSLLCLAMAVIAAPAIFALMALLRGDFDAALYVFGPVLLIPLVFVVVGVYFSLKRHAGGGGNGADDE